MLGSTGHKFIGKIMVSSACLCNLFGALITKDSHLFDKEYTIPYLLLIMIISFTGSLLIITNRGGDLHLLGISVLSYGLIGSLIQAVVFAPLQRYYEFNSSFRISLASGAISAVLFSFWLFIFFRKKRADKRNKTIVRRISLSIHKQPTNTLSFEVKGDDLIVTKVVEDNDSDSEVMELSRRISKVINDDEG